MKFKGSEKWEILKKVLYEINKFHKINAYSIGKKKLKRMFDLSTPVLNHRDDINTMKNNNFFVVKDDMKYIEIIPRKNKFKIVFSNYVVYEEILIHKDHLSKSNFMKKFKTFAFNISSLEKLIINQTDFMVDEKIMERNFKKDLIENAYIIYDEDGFYCEIVEPKNSIEKIKEYLEDYIKTLKKKLPDIKTNYEINLKYFSKV